MVDAFFFAVVRLSAVRLFCSLPVVGCKCLQTSQVLPNAAMWERHGCTLQVCFFISQKLRLLSLV